MIVTKLTVPVALVVSMVIGSVSAVYAADHYFAKVSDIKTMAKQQAARDDRQWIEMLEQKLRAETDPEEREVIKRQIKRTEESLYRNLGNDNEI